VTALLIALVTDRRRLAPAARTDADAIAALERWLDDAIAAGIDLVQIRERDLEAADLAGLVRRVVSRAAGTATRVVVNERVDVAIAAGAPGVHLPAAGLPTRQVRELAPRLWISRAVHGKDECTAESGADRPPDALIFGTVFPTASKDGGTPVAGLEGLAAAVRASTVPVLAIGGMTPARAAQAVAAGAAGIAAIGLFLPPGASPEALGPGRAVAALRTIIPAACGRMLE
jgi:thiamine-phosphate diphosphorylase